MTEDPLPPRSRKFRPALLAATALAAMAFVGGVELSMTYVVVSCESCTLPPKS